MWEKYYGWTPWQYRANNPVNFLDKNGKFGFSVHTEAIVSSGRGGYHYAIWNFFLNDFVNMKNSDTHFDNKQNYGEVMELINNAGGFNNLDDHTIGDFYAHSNYVDIWQQLAGEGKVSGTIPTFNNASSNSTFMEALQNGLRTTNYPDNGSDPYGHDNGYNQEGKGNQIGKNGSTINNFGSKDDDNSDIEIRKTLHNMAKDVYIRSLKEKVIDYDK